LSGRVPARAGVAASLILLAIAAHGTAVRNGFIWDDDDYVVENATLHAPDGLRQIWFEIGSTPQYYPLVHTSYWLEYRLWGLEPAGYHAVNVLLHALACLLLFSVLRSLAVPGAWLAAAIFAVHPVHVESVAWITERKNVLSGVFYLGSLLAYLRFARIGDGAGRAPRSAGLYAASLLLFAAALLSKTVTGSLPAVVLLLLYWKGRRIDRHELAPLAPFFALAVLSGWLTALLETQLVGARGGAWDLSLAERSIVAGRALFFYAGKLVVPAALTFNYPRWDAAAASRWQLLWPAAAAALVVCLWLARERIGRGPLVAVLVFAGSLAPALGFIDVFPMRYSYVADHFQYLASLGLIALFAAGAARAAAQLPERRRGTATFAALVFLAVLAALSVRQTGAYLDAETLWRDTLAKNPDSTLALVHLGAIATDGGAYDEAQALYQQALRVDPGMFEAHNNLGILFVGRGRLERGIHHYRRALQIAPGYAPAHSNLGVALVKRGDLEGGIAQYRLALRARPDFADAHKNLAVALVKQRRFDEAAIHLARVLELRPHDDAVRASLTEIERRLARKRAPPEEQP
jgi:tetratricopeptide (TPR) repeat protein